MNGCVAKVTVFIHLFLWFHSDEEMFLGNASSIYNICTFVKLPSTLLVKIRGHVDGCPLNIGIL